jgi:hypothetical protein
MILLSVPVVLTGCLPGCSVTQPKSSEDIPVSSQAVVESSSSSAVSGEVPSPIVMEEPSSSAPEPWKPKELTLEEKKFVTDVDGWMDRMRFIVSRIRKLHAEARGLAVDTGEDVDLQEKYAELHKATENLFIPDEYAETLALSQKFDQTLSEAIALLSPSPTLEELEKASVLINTLIPHMNTLNSLLHDIHY